MAKRNKINRVLSKLGKTFIYLVLFLYAHIICSQTILHINEPDKVKYSVNKYIQVFPDFDGLRTIDDIVYGAYSNLFVNDSTLKSDANYHWVRFSITNNNNKIVDWHLHITPKQNNEVFCITPQGIEFLARNGEYVRNSLSAFPENPQIIPVKLAANSSTNFYVRINTIQKKEFKNYINIDLISAKNEMTFFLRSWIILAVLVGVLISLGFYIFFQFILFRDKSFLYFFLAFTSMALYFITYERVGYAITGSDYVTRYTGNYIALLCTFFYIGFSRYFLDPDKQFPLWHKILKIIQILYIVPLTFIILINFRVFWNFTPFVHLIHIIAFIFLLSFAVFSLRKGQDLAGYYLWANSIFFIFLCLFVYYVIKKPIELTLTNHILASSLKIGSFGQVLLFTLALSNRFGQLNRKVIEKQLENELLEKDQLIKIRNITLNANIELEKKVLERTAEINSQKEELKTQAENIETALKKISQQKKMIEQAHSQITDSLFYASLIQGAVLPSENIMQQCFSDSFAIYWPRDIVSGDFYWVTKIDEVVLFAVADCTGHGVPGGFMSMLGISQLNEIIKRERIIQPEMVLSIIRENLTTALQQDSNKSEIRDGMDIALCALFKESTSPENNTYLLVYAGIQIPCYIVKRKDAAIDASSSAQLVSSNDDYCIYSIKPNRIPININITPDIFQRKTILVEKGDMIYLTTDGITDLIGGGVQKKFSKRQLYDIMLEIQNFKSDEQKNFIEKRINEWVNAPDPITGSPSDQIDDICLVGIRI